MAQFEQRLLTNVSVKLETIKSALDTPFTESIQSTIWDLEEQAKRLKDPQMKEYYSKQLAIADSQVRSVAALLSQLSHTMQALSATAHNSKIVSGAFQDD